MYIHLNEYKWMNDVELLLQHCNTWSRLNVCKKKKSMDSFKNVFHEMC